MCYHSCTRSSEGGVGGRGRPRLVANDPTPKGPLQRFFGAALMLSLLPGLCVVAFLTGSDGQGDRGWGVRRPLGQA